MSRSKDILFQLKNKLEEMGGVGFVSQYPTDDEYIDVPDLVDEPYVTNRHFDLPDKRKQDGITPKKTKKESAVLEQGEKEGVPPEAAGAAAGEEAGAEAGAAAAEAGSEPMPDMGGAGGIGTMPGAGDMGGDMGMGGFGQEEEPKTTSELGRIYELKKIYTRLTSIESYLAHESDDTLLKIRTTVSQGIELFEVVASNFDSYKGNLDEIIITFYKFLAEVYSKVSEQFKKLKNEEK